MIVIPAFNEESSLPEVLAAMPKELHGLDVETIVVSDGSDRRDRGGGAAVRRAGRRTRPPPGQGAAVRLGYRVALARGPSVVATVDSDGQYDPLELPQLVAPILAGEADVVHGSRALGSYEDPIAGRSHGVKFFAWLMTRIAGTPITDPASGFRAFSPVALHALELRENQFHASEVTIAASKLGLARARGALHLPGADRGLEQEAALPPLRLRLHAYAAAYVALPRRARRTSARSGWSTRRPSSTTSNACSCRPCSACTA